MTRTWVLLIGATLLWVSVCVGQEGYTEPATGDAGVGEVAPGVVDPGSVGGSEVTEPTPDGGPEILGSETDGDYKIVTLLPEGTNGAADATPEGVCRVLALVANGDTDSLTAQLPADAAAGVGMPERISQWTGLLISNHPNLGSMPELSQIRSGVGLDMAAFSEAVRNVPTFTGQIDNVSSQISGQAQEVFSAFPIRGVADLLANQ